MSEWKEFNLGEICSDISYGYTESASLEPIGPKFLRITDIVPGRVDWETVPYCKISSEKRIKYQLQNGDIVIARTGATTGYTYTIKPADMKHDSVFASYLIRYRVNTKKAEPFFIGHLLTSTMWQGFVEGILGGSAQPGANAKQFADFEILLPPLPEQHAIAGVLSSLDDKIDLLHRQNKTLEGMAEALWRKMFVEEAHETWEMVLVKDVINILSGFTFKSSDFVDDGRYRLITIKNVQDGYLDLSRTDYIDVIPGRTPDYCLLQSGDILLSLTGNVGRCCLVNEENLLLNQRVAKLQARNIRDWAFTYIMFRQASMRSVLEELAKGTAQANLSPLETANYEIQNPPDDLLEKYSAEATPLIEKVLNNFNQIHTLSRLRDTLLPRLMSGEVRVKYN